MKHRNKQRVFGRKRDERRAFLKSLALGLVEHGSMVTTEARAKEIRSFVEKLVTLSKKDSLASKRLVVTRLGSRENGAKLAREIAPRYKERKGGYTRITKLPSRKGDSSPMAKIEFV